MVLVHDLLTASNNASRLVAEETRGLNERLQFARIGVCKGLSIWITSEQGGRHHVDADIGALSRKNCSDEKLERISMMQRTVSVRIHAGQSPVDLSSVIGE